MVRLRPCIRSSSAVAAAVTLFTLGLPSAQGAVTTVAPFASTALEGNNSLGTALNNLARTLQFVYGSAEMATSGISSGNIITGLAFRLDTQHVSAFPTTDYTYTNYFIQLATSVNAPGSLSTTFASNVGGDAVTVYNQGLAIAAGAYIDIGAGSPNPFGPVIVFTSPFTYAGGDLLVTIKHSAQGSTIGFTDAVNNVSGAFQGQYAESAAALTASNATRTQIVQLTYLVPEPATGLALAGAAAFFLYRRRSPR